MLALTKGESGCVLQRISLQFSKKAGLSFQTPLEATNGVAGYGFTLCRTSDY